MNNALFSDDFIFTQFCFNALRHNDNSYGIEYHYIGYMREGYANIVSKNHSFIVNEGDFFYLPKHFKYHSYWNVGDNGNACFDSYAFKSMPLQKNIAFEPQTISPFDVAIKLNKKLNRDKNISLQSVGIFYQLLGVLSDKMLCAPQEKKHHIVQMAEEYMQENIHSKAPDIARFCQTNQTELYEAFKLVRGYTPVTAKHKIVVKMACELLITTDMSIEEISSKLGFGNAAYFRKIFFEETHKTPREFRKTAIF